MKVGRYLVCILFIRRPIEELYSRAYIKIIHSTLIFSVLNTVYAINIVLCLL